MCGWKAVVVSLMALAVAVVVGGAVGWLLGWMAVDVDAVGARLHQPEWLLRWARLAATLWIEGALDSPRAAPREERLATPEVAALEWLWVARLAAVECGVLWNCSVCVVCGKVGCV